jgi:hypothetical protein
MLLVDIRVTFTDLLVWSILVDRFELAQAISNYGTRAKA